MIKRTKTEFYKDQTSLFFRTKFKKDLKIPLNQQIINKIRT